MMMLIRFQLSAMNFEHQIAMIYEDVLVVVHRTTISSIIKLPNGWLSFNIRSRQIPGIRTSMLERTVNIVNK